MTENWKGLINEYLGIDVDWAILEANDFLMKQIEILLRLLERNKVQIKLTEEDRRQLAQMGAKIDPKKREKYSMLVKGYLTIVRDLNSGAVLFVGKGKSAESLDEFVQKVRRSKAKIETIAVDLAPSFTSWIQYNFPEALIVYDHFHVIKLMNDKIHNIRRRTMNSLEENEKKALKNRRWHFVRNREHLNPQAAQELEDCKNIFEDLATAHYLKEALRAIYKMAGSKDLADVAFERWYEMAVVSKIPEMLTMANTVKKHIKGILAYWQTGGISSASMEGFNNKIGWLTRQAYGYRDEEYLILKIHDLPNVSTRKKL